MSILYPQLFILIAVAAVCLFVGLVIGRKQKEKECSTEVFHANQSAGSYISMMLHHLRTPLAGMMWSLKDMNKEAPEGSTQKEQLKRLYDENLRLLGVVENLLQSSRISSGHVNYDFDVTNTSNIEQQILRGISEMSAEAYEKNISLHIETLPISNRNIKVDQEKIISIIQTLFENSLRYTDPGGNITVKTGEKDGYFFFEISDTGIGIPEKDQKNIFIQFFRADNAQKKIPNGYGIGLFLVKTFTDAHGGTVSYSSKEGHGSTFTVHLPLL